MIKTYCSSFTMRLGPATTTGILTPIRKSIKPKYKYCTPKVEEVRQVYVGPDGKTLYEKEDLGRAQWREGKFVPVPLEEIEDAKESQFPLNVVDLTIHPRSEIENYLYPADSNGYIFQPIKKNSKGKVIDDPVNLQWYDFINVVLRDNDDIALVGQCNLQNYEGLYRLGFWNGYITMQKQLFPEELHEYQPYQSGMADDVRQTALAVSAKLTTGFDPATYRDFTTERLTALQGGDIGALAGKVKEAPAPLDMKSVLAAML